MKVKLSEIITGLEFQNERSGSYLERATGLVVSISEEDLNAAEDDDADEDSPDWQIDNIEIAKKILDNSNTDYLQLPTQWDIHEYEMMESFVSTIEDVTIFNALSYALKGKHAFRRFKDAVYEYGIEKQWFAYRDSAYKDIAIEWCQENHIDFEDDVNHT
ncbi:MAG TPA: UPF0158 family protein [Anaerohalosphaeraceae bacterium]|nr:UPF0158 family protein [Anaerohalosphaeraceae bacterium]